MVNPNTAWINERGTWLFYLAMLVLTRYSVFIFGIKTDAAWTSVLLGHSIITFWLFHWKRGSLLSWEDDAGKYDRLTYWEQIDGGREYSSNKKFLTIIPLILLFLAYETCTMGLFAVNLAFTLLVTVPKLPVFGSKKTKHRRGQSGSYAFLNKPDDGEDG